MSKGIRVPKIYRVVGSDGTDILVQSMSESEAMRYANGINWTVSIPSAIEVAKLVSDGADVHDLTATPPEPAAVDEGHAEPPLPGNFAAERACEA